MQVSAPALASVVAFSLGLPTDTLPSAVYHAPPAPRASARPVSQVVLKGSTLDLQELVITTTTLPPGQVLPPQPGGAEALVIVEAGQLAATLHDSTKILSPGGVLLAMASEPPALRNPGPVPVRYWTLRFSAAEGAQAQRGQAAGGSWLRDWPRFPVSKTDKGETRPVFDRPSSMFARFDVHATVLKPGLASHPPHTHRAEEIVLMTQGRGQIQIANRAYPAAAGDVILLRANVPHAFTNSSSAPCGYFAIQWHTAAEVLAK